MVVLGDSVLSDGGNRSCWLVRVEASGQSLEPPGNVRGHVLDAHWPLGPQLEQPSECTYTASLRGPEQSHRRGPQGDESSYLTPVFMCQGWVAGRHRNAASHCSGGCQPSWRLRWRQLGQASRPGWWLALLSLDLLSYLNLRAWHKTLFLSSSPSRDPEGWHSPISSLDSDTTQP